MAQEWFKYKRDKNQPIYTKVYPKTVTISARIAGM